jgi:hypothetical protein
MSSGALSAWRRWLGYVKERKREEAGMASLMAWRNSYQQYL